MSSGCQRVESIVRRSRERLLYGNDQPRGSMVSCCVPGAQRRCRIILPGVGRLCVILFAPAESFNDRTNLYLRPSIATPLRKSPPRQTLNYVHDDKH